MRFLIAAAMLSATPALAQYSPAQDRSIELQAQVDMDRQRLNTIQSDNFAALNAANFFNEICRNLADSFNPGEVELMVDAKPVSISLEAATPLGLLATELIMNAYKHAFPAGRGTITVRLHPAGSGRVTLTISDDGAGLGDGWRGKGTGIAIAERLAAQLGGDLVVSSHSGTSFSVTFQDAGKGSAR